MSWNTFLIFAAIETATFKHSGFVQLKQQLIIYQDQSKKQSRFLLEVDIRAHLAS